MALQELDVITFNTKPDETGDIFQSPLNVELTMANAKKMFVLVMKDPAGAGDEGFESNFKVPQNYDNTVNPLCIINYVLDGGPSSQTVAFGLQKRVRANAESVDVVYDAQQIASEVPGEADEELVEETIILTAADYTPGRNTLYFFFIDDSVHTYTGNILLLSMGFRYTVT